MGRFSVYHDRAYAGGAVAQPMRNGPSVGAGRPGASTGLGRALWPGIGRIIGLDTTRMRGRRQDGPPVYTYEAVPGVPPVGAMTLGRELSPGGLPDVHSHSHDFLVLDYFERGGGSLRLADKQWQIEAGDVYLIAPGEVADASGLEAAEGWGVFFPPEGLGSGAPGAFLSWRAHPLLFPFVRGAAGGAQ